MMFQKSKRRMSFIPGMRRFEGDSKSSGSKDKDDELSTKEMLKISMQRQGRTMEIALKATLSPSKDEKD